MAGADGGNFWRELISPSVTDVARSVTIPSRYLVCFISERAQVECCVGGRRCQEARVSVPAQGGERSAGRAGRSSQSPVLRAACYVLPAGDVRPSRAVPSRAVPPRSGTNNTIDGTWTCELTMLCFSLYCDNPFMSYLFTYLCAVHPGW